VEGFRTQTEQRSVLACPEHRCCREYSTEAAVVGLARHGQEPRLKTLNNQPDLKRTGFTARQWNSKALRKAQLFIRLPLPVVVVKGAVVPNCPSGAFAHAAGLKYTVVFAITGRGVHIRGYDLWFLRFVDACSSITRPSWASWEPPSSARRLYEDHAAASGGREQYSDQIHALQRLPPQEQEYEDAHPHEEDRR